MDHAINWPKFSIITPVFNGAKHLETCIQSVLAQHYPNLEFIILDAGSTDGTVDIIRKYEKHIAFWRSHPDGGSAPAVNEGIRRATGEIFGWINADDWYEPGILQAVVQAFKNEPSAEIVACQSRVVQKRPNGELQEIFRFEGKKLGIYPGAYSSPNIRFFRTSVFATYGPLCDRDDDGIPMNVQNDFELMLRLSLNRVRCVILDYMGYTHLSHDGSLTFSGKYIEAMRHKRVRYRQERIFVTEKHLRLGHSWRTRRKLHKWHARASAYLFHEYRQTGKKSEMWREVKRGLAYEPILWLFETARLRLSGRSKQV